jgi:hypothetical protein
VAMPHDRDAKLDEDLRTRLEGLGEDDTVDVLVHPGPSADAGDLDAHLTALMAAGELRFNPLPLHGSIAVRAPCRLVFELAARDDVTRVTSMPTAGTLG